MSAILQPPPAPSPHSADRPWHVLSARAVLGALAVDPGRGLDAAAVAERRRRYGANVLPEPPRRGPLRRFLLQFDNLLIHVLMVAGVLTLALGHGVDAGVIFGVVVINAVVGFLQEGKAERALDAIRGMLSPTAVALRDGHRRRVGVDDLVPGDIVVLASGDRVPADLRLIRTRGLRIEEAALTGESVPVDKDAAVVPEDAPLAERPCLAYSGTMVVSGQGEGVVIGTGPATELGRISAMLAGVAPLQTPLLRQMARFSRWLTGGVLALAAATFAYGVVVQGYTMAEMFLAVVGLAVAAIPEGLPAIMTITLAIGVQRMAGRNAILRRLPAVETLGSVSVICSDKTGTLTRNEMTVADVVSGDGTFTVSGGGYAAAGEILDASGAVVDAEAAGLTDLLRACVLCNDADVEPAAGAGRGTGPDQGAGQSWVVSGDPMEGALLVLAAKAGLDVDLLRREFPRRDAIPFESEHKFMASLHHDHAGNAFVVLKGAPEQVLTRCHGQRVAGGERPLDPRIWHAAMDDMAGRGRRVLALAFLPMPHGEEALTFGDVLGGLTLLGLVGLIDPPRDEAIAAIRRVAAAGIAVKMITGDHPATARAIGRQLGLGDGPVLTGGDLDGLDGPALTRAARETAIFARTSPAHKLRLVEALQDGGQVIAMTGDGVNDAPALKRADVGVAMGGKGTEAAKEAAEMVLADDNFASIAAAVEEGRTVYDNLKKAILFILPTNGGEAFVMVTAIVLGVALPLTPKQILWVNMITAVTLALALAFEPAERGLMSRPPRRADEPLLSGHLVWRIVYVSALMVAVTMALFTWQMGRLVDIEAARTVAVNAMVAGEIAYLWNVRRLHGTVLTPAGLFGSWPVLLAIALVAGFQLLFTYAGPFQALFDTRPLDGAAWAMIAGGGVAVLLAVEAEKAVAGLLRRRHRRRVEGGGGGGDVPRSADPAP
jgi:magnesium-transporting ATPase (P-type)